MVEENYADGYDENDVLVMAMHHHSTIEQIKISNPNHKKIIIYQLEPLLSKDHWWSEEFIISRIKDADEVWDYDLDNIKILREHGINAKFKPFIYAESLKRVENKEEPDIDVFFYGTPTEHRSKILEIISNCGVFNEDSPSPSAPCVVTGFNLTKQSLDEFISRSKIIIDLQDNHLFKKSPDEFIQKQSRIYYALINNKCVVSEKSKRNYYGDLIIEAEKDDLLEKIIYLLNEDRWKSYSNVSERFKNLTHYQVLKNSLHPQNYFYAQESKPKIAVVTASIGTKDIKDPPLLFDNTDFYAFVDESKLNVKDSWKRNKFLDFSLDAVYKNRRNAKIYKVLPHLFIPDYDYYIWIDSTHYVAMDPNKIIEDLLSDSDIAVFKHPERDCVYEEAAFVKEINYDHHHLIDSVIDLYQNQNYPRNSGLYENPARIQRNTPEIQKLMLSWWEMICNYTSRDQITFPYALKQNNIIPAIIPGLSKRVNQNEYFPMYEESDHNRQF
jgi:hypothetical protein